MADLGEKKSFEKQVLRIGSWKHDAAPNGILNITKDYLQKIANNFNKNPFVPVYRGHASDDEAAKNPELIVTKNIDSFKVTADGLNAIFQIDADEVDKYNDVSLSIQDDYEDHETGTNLGPVARHIALVPSPYIKGLNPFIALKEKTNYSILLSEINMADKQETKAEEVKVEEVITEPTKESEVIETPEPTVEATVEETPKEEKPEEKKTEEATIDNSETSEDIKVQLEELKREKAELVQEITAQKANNLYNKYLQQGKVLPSMEKEFISLASVSAKTVDLSDKKETSVEAILIKLMDKMPVMVNLKEKGINPDSPKALDVKPELIESMRKSFFLREPDATEEQFQEYIDKNKKIIRDNN